MDEENKVEETSTEDASSSISNGEESQNTELTEEGTVESQDSEDSTADTFKAELERVKQKLGEKIDKERTKRIEAEKQKGLSPDDVERLVRESVSLQTASLRADIEHNRAHELASRLSESDSERDLTLHYLEYGVNPNLGSLEERIEAANAMANRSKFKSRLSELKTSIRSKELRGGGSQAGAPAQNTKAPQITQADIDGAKFAGVTPEQFMKWRVEQGGNK